MSLILNTIEAFPRGKTTEQVLLLTNASFNQEKKLAVLAELDELQANGLLVKGRDGRWRPARYKKYRDDERKPEIFNEKIEDEGILYASEARFSKILKQDLDSDNMSEGASDTVLAPSSMLKYFRSVLRADPRGAIKRSDHTHGFDWHLICGNGPIISDNEYITKITIELDNLIQDFRPALKRREDHSNSIALGWPLAVGKKDGVPIVWPVGLLSASWERTKTHLEITIESDDVLINPDWIQGTSRSTAWSKKQLQNVFSNTEGEGVGLTPDDFITRLNEVMAGNIKTKLSGRNLRKELNLRVEGVYDMCSIFLPNESSFTAKAGQEVEAISKWSLDEIRSTALAPLLGLDEIPFDSEFFPINPGPLNGEQLRAVNNACRKPFSIVTGPPGTGKSQAIVSMVASILMNNGRVLVASKNHQALDAVEDRFETLSPKVPFCVRTLNKEKNIDISFKDILKSLVSDENKFNSHSGDLDSEIFEKLISLSKSREKALNLLDHKNTLETKISEVLDRIEIRGSNPSVITSGIRANSTDRNIKPTRFSIFEFLVRVWRQLFRKKKIIEKKFQYSSESELSRLKTSDLKMLLTDFRNQKASLEKIDDIIEISEKIEKLTKKLIPSTLAHRSSVNEAQRAENAQQFDDYEFQASETSLWKSLTDFVLDHRPLWLASILGIGNRIPLEPGIFDLVIFDEASQCDIASAIPLLARSKRAVVVGDAQQLSFMPQLSQAQDKNLMQAQGLPLSQMSRYAQSKRSLFDLAKRITSERVTLKHQYRSAGGIVEYINKYFYGGQLIVAQPLDNIKVPKNQKPGIEWTNVYPPSYIAGHVNQNEIQAITAQIKKLLEQDHYTGTIGVTSPFRSQVQALKEAIESSVEPKKLEKAEMRVATVDGFQGQERDLILFSPSVSSKSSASALTFYQRDHRRLNVAISRAKAVAHIFGDLQFAKSAKIKSLAKLAAHATEPRVRSKEGVFDSFWEERVYYALKDRGLKPNPQFEIAGRYLDFALFGKEDIKLDLEVDGRRWHQTADGQRKSSDIWRDAQMKALGWRIRRFWVDELEKDMEGCLDLVEQDLQ